MYKMYSFEMWDKLDTQLKIDLQRTASFAGENYLNVNIQEKHNWTK